MSALGLAEFSTLEIALLVEDAPDMRQVAPSPLADAALTESIKRRGVLQPIGVRPVQRDAGSLYQVAFGRRRLRCARAAGLERVPAIIGEWTDIELRAVTLAENMQRVEPHPVDVWRATAQLIDQGYTAKEAAIELGTDERSARRIEQLGRLHPGLLKVAEIEMPDDDDLRQLARAPLDAQAHAAARPNLVHRYPNGEVYVAWHVAVSACRVTRIAQPVAIFDVAAAPLVWDEDLFAQPDDPARFSTADVDGFVQCQREALQRQVNELRGKRQRAECAAFDARKSEPKLPDGWRRVATLYQGDKKRPSRTEAIFHAVAEDGRIVRVLAENVAAAKAAKRAAAAPASGAGSAAPAEAEDDAAEADAPAGADAPPTMTKKGLELVATAKTTALGHALTAAALEGSPATMLRLLLASLMADNVSIRPYGHAEELRERLLTALVLPDGMPAEIEDGTLCHVAAAALQAILIVRGPNTPVAAGDAAEWVGHWLLAGRQLARFDTEAFLAQQPLATLQALATEAGISSVGTAAGLRSRLTGKLPDWRPAAAQFGAPG